MINLNLCESDILVNYVITGDTRAETELYKRCKQIISSYLWYRSNSKEDFEDDVSEIIIKVFANLNSYNPIKGKFSTWVNSIAKNYLIDKYRTNKIRIPKHMPEYEFWMYISDDSCWEKTFEINDMLLYMSKKMKKSDYDMMQMKYQEGYSYDEIGKHYNLTSNTVSNRINYVKNKTKLSHSLKNEGIN